MLFFQLGLLLGYSYAHAIVRFLGTRHQVITHMVLLGVSVALLPITPPDGLKPDGTGSPVTGILYLLATSVGAPYVLISATGPLLQHWYSMRFVGKSPYRLYALSNVASLLGLLTYPFIFERLWDLPSQTLYWSIGYGCFIVACAVSALSIYRYQARNQARLQEPGGQKTQQRLGLANPLLWIAFSATGSILLLAITNKLTEDVAAIAFLWIVPLSLYLLTFIIAFDGPQWYHRGFWVIGFALVVPAAVNVISSRLNVQADQLMGVMAVYLALMFFGCMVCHGEMVRLKPEPEHLTVFYLLVSFGGALGGLFVGVVCPLLFTGFWELHIGIVLVLVLSAYSMARTSDWTNRPILKRILAAAWVVGTLTSAGLLAKDITNTKTGVISVTRNFYGVIRVIEENIGSEYHRYKFYHGTIHHGQQFQSEKRRTYPTSYFGHGSGVGIAIRKHPKRQRSASLHVGVIGMGAGTLATYAQSRDRVRYYEIDPDVIGLAETYFTFLQDSKGSVTSVVGDARISLEREFEQQGSLKFDILAVDAFSGDAIPVHLLTREACQLYKSHLAEGGILAFHISNRFVNLKPVVLALAKSVDMTILRIESNRDRRKGAKKSEWVLLTNNEEFLTNESVRKYRKDWPKNDEPETLWTDHYSSLVELLK
jgi:hypothetical protein